MSWIVSMLPALALVALLIIGMRFKKKRIFTNYQPGFDAFKKRFDFVGDFSTKGSETTCELSGIIDGLSVRLHTVFIENRNDYYPRTTLTIYLSEDLPAGLGLVRKGTITTLKNAFSQNLHTGNPSLDAAVFLQAQDEQAALELFQNVNIAVATLDFLDRYPMATLADGRLTATLPRSIDAGAELIMLSFLEFVQILSGRVDYKSADHAALAAGMLGFEDSARLVEDELARRARERETTDLHRR